MTGKVESIPAHKLQFRPSVYAVLIHDGKMLLNPFKGGWIFPGGGTDVGETLEAALAREVFEETGLTVRQDTFIYFEEDFVASLTEVDMYFHTYRWYFLCKDPIGEITTDGFTELERSHVGIPEWIPLNRLGDLKVHHPKDTATLFQKAIERL